MRRDPIGMLVKMYRHHLGTLSVEVSGDSPQPKPAFPPGGDQHAVNPGSPTYPLDVVATFSDDRKTFTIAVLNPSDTPASMNLTISGTRLADQGTLWQMAPDKIDAVIALGKKPEVRVEEKPQGPISSNIVAPPFSVNINSYPVQ